MNEEEIRLWCMQQPRPHSVRVTDVEGVMNDVICGLSTWVKVSETIAALRPDLLQAMTQDGKLIRALRPNDVSTDWTPSEERTPRAVRVPEYSIPIQNMDPEAQKLQLVANLIAQAYRHSTDVAFERLSQMVETMAARQESVERTRESMYRAHVRQLEEQIKALGQDPAESPTDLLGGLVQSFMQGAAMGGSPPAAAPPAAAPNGKAH